MKKPARNSRGKIVRGRALLPTSITALLAGCPIDDSNPDHCPLHAVRKLPPKEALAWLQDLTTDDKSYLLQYHGCCLAHEIEQQRTAQSRKATAESPGPVG